MNQSGRVCATCADWSHAEAFFARAILIVEGPSEREAIPIYARAGGIDFDALGISIVNAGGKTNIDSLYHLYRAHGIPIYVVFDNDRGGQAEDIGPNAVLTKMLGLEEAVMPDGIVAADYAILEKNFESVIRSDLDAMGGDGLYDDLHAEACQALGGKSKPLAARYIADQLTENGLIPATIMQIAKAVEELVARDSN